MCAFVSFGHTFCHVGFLFACFELIFFFFFWFEKEIMQSWVGREVGKNLVNIGAGVNDNQNIMCEEN